MHKRSYKKGVEVRFIIHQILYAIKYKNSNEKYKISYQNEIFGPVVTLSTFLNEDDVIKTVKKINKDLNGNIPQVEVFRNLTWKPMKFQFSNMFIT